MEKKQFHALFHNLIQEHPAFVQLLSSIKKNAGTYWIHGVNEGLEIPLALALEETLQASFWFSLDPDMSLNQTSSLLFAAKQTTIALPQLSDVLTKSGYQRVEKTYQEGEFSINGGIVDIYYDHVIIRIDFFGNTIDQIYLIDPLSGRVQTKLLSASIPPFPTMLHLSSYQFPMVKDLMLLFHNHNNVQSVNAIHFDFQAIPVILNNEKLLQFELKKRSGGKIFVVSQKSKSFDMFEVIPDEYNIKTTLLSEDFYPGFSSKLLNTSVFTDKEIYGRLNLKVLKKKKNKNLLLISDISIGDMIVHEDHGIGIYKGIVKQEVSGESREYLSLEYAKEDKLFVPLDQIAKLTKFIGAHGESPKLTRLGTAEWEKAKERVRKNVEDIAGELLQIYAMREVIEKPYTIIETNYYKELENDFAFTLTPDQQTSIDEISKDLESSKPMDRLIVGDVGYGKTEVAIRSAFKVVDNGMQAAILAPTTILAEQLYEVFKERMGKFSVNIEALSRFQGTQKNKEVIQKLKEGKVDVVIGTHRLLQSDVSFKNLGLLVIDEEQRFGVKQKERLKALRMDTNVLSMSATPIPRTMHMALSGAKDISIINTPPQGRRSVKTFVIQKNWEKVAAIIKEEVEQGRQIFFLHNKVANITSITASLADMLPDIRFIEGHGQMHSDKLENILNAFRLQEYDVLVASTIIENGIDIPRVNTIIINDAQNFGLAQLYQLRGRVGRSSTQSYCYLVYPVDYELEGAARLRMDAIMNAQELGSGFQIAVKDLEIRGAGNFLGSEQHGSISAVGFELYTNLLAAEVEKLRHVSYVRKNISEVSL